MKLLTVKRAWSPILDGEKASQAAAAVDAVAEAIGDGPLPARYAVPGLGTGEAGVALFFEYLDRARPGAGYGELAQLRLERAIDSLVHFQQLPNLYGGFAGIAWAVEHLQNGPAGDVGRAAAEEPADEEDPNQDIDAALLVHLRQSPWERDYDLISGLAGYGVYALERLPRPSAVACLELVVDRLAEVSDIRPGGIAWFTPPHLVPGPNRPWYPDGYENMGVAHGLPGVIAVLARICAAGVAVERARPLLEGAVSWLLAQKLPAGERSVFPYALCPGAKAREARMAWCYGDPGIALVLLAAGRLVGEPAWEREALDLAHTIARRPPEGSGVADAGLCHGAAGLGHLFNRLYQATGDPEALAAARSWLDCALGFREPGRGIGGFRAYSPPPDDFDRLEWNDDPGFLTGAAGVGLALLAAISDVEPAWDRLLLVSPLPGNSGL